MVYYLCFNLFTFGDYSQPNRHMSGSIYILAIDNHLALAIDAAIGSIYIPTAACMD